MLLGDRTVEQQPGALAILRHQVDARDRSHRAASAIATGVAVEPDRAADATVDAEDDAGQFGAPGADEAGEAEDLAAPHRQV